MTNKHTESLNILLEARDVVDYFELLHDASLKNMVTVYTVSAESMIRVATFIKQLAVGFVAPAIFHNENMSKIENFLTDNPDNLSMALVYAMQVFKHDRKVMIPAIASMMAQAWDINYGAKSVTAQYCEEAIENFPGALIVFMCMLFPNTTIGMLNQLLSPPTASDKIPN